MLLDKGFHIAASKCLWVYNHYDFSTAVEDMDKGTGSKVDYVVMVVKFDGS
jgi:hypothetical protein